MTPTEARALLLRGEPPCPIPEHCTSCGKRAAALAVITADAWKTGVAAEAARTRGILAAADLEIRDGIVRELAP